MTRKSDEFADMVTVPATQIEFTVGVGGSAGSDRSFFTGNFRDECFVMSQGVASMPHPEVSGTLTGETALWAYRHIVQKPFYAKDREKLVRRIFRSVNISCWQKQRESGFEEGLAATLLVVITGQRNIWIGNVGNHAAVVVGGGRIIRQTFPDVDQRGVITKLIGLKRYGLLPQYINCTFGIGDTAVMLSADAAKVISAQDITKESAAPGADAGKISAALVAKAERLNASGRLGIIVIRRTPSALPESSLLVNPI